MVSYVYQLIPYADEGCRFSIELRWAHFFARRSVFPTAPRHDVKFDGDFYEIATGATAQTNAVAVVTRLLYYHGFER